MTGYISLGMKQHMKNEMNWNKNHLGIKENVQMLMALEESIEEYTYSKTALTISITT